MCNIDNNIRRFAHELGRIVWAIFHPRRNNFRYDVALACLEEVSRELHQANQKIKELSKERTKR